MTLASPLLALLALASQDPVAAPADPWVVYPGGEGPGAGKHIVLIAGDEEYRSEEALPMLGKILSVHHGFQCTVLFSINRETGEIEPKEQTYIPGMQALKTADLAIVFLRFRELPDEDMAHFVEFVDAGKPIIGLRTATHAFDYKRNTESRFAKYHWRAGEDWPGGFGKQILGETWVAHHGAHGSEATRGVIEPGAEDHPILRGLTDVFGPTDVYRVKLPLPEDAQVLLRGAVLNGMTPEATPVDNQKNQPMMPVVWTRTLKNGDAEQRVVCSTIGASQDFSSEGLRRVMVNACFWCLGMDDAIPAKSKVDLVGEYAPTPFGFNKATQGVRPSDHALNR
ncbi:MAG: ThuA domain-containing protein [Planctomycetota bacterium]|nr:ThuA domain-containing protein [Planctomycetota bacterium]